jgi:hypothetical protein
MGTRTLSIVLLLCLNLLDYLFTINALRHGIPEANPLLVAIVETLWFPVIKIGIVSLLIVFLWFFPPRPWVLTALVGVYGGVVLWHLTHLPTLW